MAGDAHQDNGKKGITHSAAFQLGAGRLGKTGRTVFGTVNLSAPDSVPWIWSLINVEGDGSLRVKNQIFPTYFVYEDGKLVQTVPQETFERFVQRPDELPQIEVDER
jgi:hypothetical protein